MKLILTDYIAALKEDKELDVLIQDILREFNMEIVFPPQRGRQYGVDIYAVGVDPEDNIKKLFLITVKQGNLDRNNWQNGQQALQPSLNEIATVFVRNNILPEHNQLPIKIIVAHNGYNEPNIQQNWVAFTEQYPQYEFTIWQLETLVNFVEEKLINEYFFSDNARRLLRRIIIHVSSPDYDLVDYKILLNEIINQLKIDGSNKKQNLKLLKKINLILAITIHFCEDEHDMRMAMKVSEVTLLALWNFCINNEELIDEDYLNELIQAMIVRRGTANKYIAKISPICEIKDGFCKYVDHSVTYGLVVYEHVGFIALVALELIQMAEMFADSNNELSQNLMAEANQHANVLIGLFNNNFIFFNPRLDNHVIEINLAFILLHKLGRRDNLVDLLVQFNNQLAHAKIFANIVPSFTNSIDEVFELEYNSEKRKKIKSGSSLLLANLIEWTVVVDSKPVYDAYVKLKNKVFKDYELVLWFPDAETEKVMFERQAVSDTGYTLSHIEAVDSYDEFKQITMDDNEHNSPEKDFYHFRQRIWTIGLIASRHFRTYVFPYCWRQFIRNAKQPEHVA